MDILKEPIAPAENPSLERSPAIPAGFVLESAFAVSGEALAEVPQVVAHVQRLQASLAEQERILRAAPGVVEIYRRQSENTSDDLALT